MKRIRTLVYMTMTVMMLMLMNITAYAANEISSISASVAPLQVTELNPNEMIYGIEPAVFTNGCSIYEYSISNGSKEVMRSYTYEITFVPEADYVFAKDVNVSVNGASKVTVKSLTDTKCTVQVKTYPYYRLKNVRDIEEDGNGYTWKKSTYAKQYNVYIWYEDEDGYERTTTRLVSTNYVDLGDFYDYNEVEKVAVQALPGSNEEEWQYLVKSEYVNEDNEVDSEVSSVISDFSYPYATGSKQRSKSHSSGSTGSSGYYNNTANQYGWIRSPMGTWFKNPDGSWPANAWMYIDDNWYFFDANGYLVTNKWILWKDKYYLLSENGSMYHSGWTPDGFWVDDNGAWVPNKMP